MLSSGCTSEELPRAACWQNKPNSGCAKNLTHPSRKLTQPRDILVDGAPATLPTGRNLRDWAVDFPSGDHHVTVITNTKAGVAVNVVGWASSWVIGAFGVLVTALMAIVYLQLRLERLIKCNGYLICLIRIWS
jgi:hypothetical protein